MALCIVSEYGSTDSGVLKDGAGKVKPINYRTALFSSGAYKRNSTTVLVNTVASENPDEAGRYSMDVEYGQYSVILLVEGFPPSHAEPLPSM
ncbi:prophage tail fiber N-terminal domain-containing protein, partial [Escherichia coli]